MVDLPLFPDDQPDDFTRLADWWRKNTEEEISKTVPKIVEYGTNDLHDIGRELYEFAGVEYNGDDLSAYQAELGIYFYVRGKMARWAEAIKSGRRVSDDTLFDLRVYVAMAQRYRENGGELV